MAKHLESSTAPDGANVDADIDLWLAGLLRWGTLLAAATIALAGALYLVWHGGEAPRYHKFHGEPQGLTSVSGILHDAAQGHSLGLLMLGLLLLIATPIARVIGALAAFAFRRDLVYVVISGVVLAGLLYGLLAS
jgi:uncharacterized membrane protein